MTAKIAFEDAPVINIVSKLDLLKKLGRPQMNLVDLENLSGLHYMFWDFGDDDGDTPAKAFDRKYGALTRSLADLIESYMNFNGYLLCDISCKELLVHIIGQLDKSNGYFN